jgi:arylsulfatase A-like enzyme
MGGCIDNYSHYFYWDGPNVHDLHRDGGEIWQPGRFFPDLMVEEANRFIEANRDRPFFLFLPFNLPHYPYQPDLAWLEHFRHLPHPRNLYAAFLATMDQRIGQVLATVEALGLTQETIVIFQPDHGHSTEERACWGGGCSGPYRGAKFSLFEGGIRLPAVIAAPGRLPAGAVRGQLTYGCDWLPTLARLCGFETPEGIDGLDILPVLQSAEAASPHEVLHWQMGTGPQAQWAVRRGDWKLIGNAWDTSLNDRGSERTPLFLANLAQDPGERCNLIEEQAAVAAELRAERERWLRRL